MISATSESRGGPERTRTSDLRFRKPLLYPAELRDQEENVVSRHHSGIGYRPLKLLSYMRWRPNCKTARRSPPPVDGGLHERRGRLDAVNATSPAFLRRDGSRTNNPVFCRHEPLGLRIEDQQHPGRDRTVGAVHRSTAVA